MTNNNVFLKLEERAAYPNLGGSPGLGGGQGPSGSSNVLERLYEEYKNNPAELLLMLVYVYLPAKEEGMENYIGHIGDQLKYEAKLLDKWDELQNDLTKLGLDASEGKKDQFKMKKGTDYYKYIQDLRKFKFMFNSYVMQGKIPNNANTKDFISTVERAMTNLGDLKSGEQLYKWFASPDQTQIKDYMNNITIGKTAFTSISNLTQERLQLFSKQFDSVEGLDKSGFKFFTQQEQTMVNNQRSS